MSRNKMKKKLKRQKLFTTLEQKRFWGFYQFWQLILDKFPTFCFLCGKYIAPALRDSRIKQPYKKQDVCHESCWKVFMDMKHITERLNENSELICHIDLGWKVQPSVCRTRVKNDAQSIMKHLVEFHGWRKIPQFAQRDIEAGKYPRKEYLQGLKFDAEKWFQDNQLIWSEFRNIHFLRPNGKSFPKVRA